MRTESYEIVIPEKARVMTEEEMEYEGLGIPVTVYRGGGRANFGNLLRGIIFSAFDLGTKKTVKISVNKVSKMTDLSMLAVSVIPIAGTAGSIVKWGTAALGAAGIIGDTSLGKAYANYLDSKDGKPGDGYVTFDVTVI